MKIRMAFPAIRVGYAARTFSPKARTDTTGFGTRSVPYALTSAL